jgi:hypothetical protein
MSPLETHHSWEPIVLENGYAFGFADGVNRYYYRSDKDNLADSLKYPANFFDDFKRASEITQENRISALTQELTAVRASLSWRLTLPLRLGLNAKNVVMALKNRNSRVTLLTRLAGRFYSNPFLRQLFQRLLSLTPKFREKLRTTVSLEVQSKTFTPDLSSKPLSSNEHAMLEKIEAALRKNSRTKDR